MSASCTGCRQLSSLPPGDSRIPGQYSFAGGTDSSMCLCLWVTIQSPLPGPVGLLMVFLTAGPVVRAGGVSSKACTVVCMAMPCDPTQLRWVGVAGWRCTGQTTGESPGTLQSRTGWCRGGIHPRTVPPTSGGRNLSPYSQASCNKPMQDYHL